LTEKVQQIGFLGEIGEFPVRDYEKVLRRWGIRGIKEICLFVKQELVHVKEHLDDEWPLVTADRLVAILDSLPF
jgi:hypothetical protein